LSWSIHIVVQFRPCTIVVSYASSVLFSFPLSQYNYPFVISLESVAINLTLGPCSYFALFAPQGIDEGFLLGNASAPFNYQAGLITKGFFNPTTGASSVEANSGGAVRILGAPATPQAAIQLLMDDVRTLVSEGLLAQGQGDGLLN